MKLSTNEAVKAGIGSAAKDIIAEGRAITGRSCGTCSLCCRLLDVPEVEKPKDDWCQHCRPGRGGCSIYEARPPTCRSYTCLWLYNNEFDDEWFPAKAKIVVDLHYEMGMTFLRFHVDPRFRNRWREEPHYSKIKRLALLGLRGDLTGEIAWTIITISGVRTLVLRQQELAYQPGFILRTGEDSFEFIPCESYDVVKKLSERRNELNTAIIKAQAKHPRLDLLVLFKLVIQDLTAEEGCLGPK